MSTVLRMDAQGKGQTVHQTALPAGDALDTRIAVIQALIPLGLQAVEEVLQRAYRLPTYAAAHAELQRLHQDLRRLNENAAKSLAEGLEETLTLHRVGLTDRLGVSLNTTNGLESILAVVEQRVGKVDRWTMSDQIR